MSIKDSFIKGFREEWDADRTRNVGATVNFMWATAAFLTILKLVGLIDWSWWWVLCPLWVPVLLVIEFIVGMLVALIFFTWLRSKGGE